jgi:elongin-A
MSVYRVESLLDMSKRATARYANVITDFGDLPYELMRHALLKIEKPEHLVREPRSPFHAHCKLTPLQYNVEQRCPQFIGKDRECWINFLKRDVPNWQSKPHEPSKPEKWFKAYQKLKKEAEAEMSKGEDSLKAALAGLKEEREKNTSTLVRAVIARPKKKAACPAKSMTLLQKIKHQTIEANRRAKNIHIQERSQQEQKQLVQNAKNPVTVAPLSMVNEIKRQNGSPPREHQPAIRAPRPAPKPPMQHPFKPTRKSSPPMHAPGTVAARRASMTDEDIAKREARLQTIKRGVREDAKANSAGPSKAASPDKPEGTLAKYLEEIESNGDDKPTGSNTPKTGVIDRPRSASPAVTLPRKRKAPPPSLFMSNKKPMVKPPTKT